MNKDKKKKYVNIKKSTWVIAFYLLLAPLDFLPILPGMSVSKFIIMIPLITCLLYLKYIKIKLNKYLVLSLIYISMLFISLFYSYSVDDSVQRATSVTLNIGVILVLSFLNYNKLELEMLKKSVVLSGWFTLGLVILYSDNNILAGRVTLVVNGVYQDPNYMSGFFIFAIVYYFNEFITKKRLPSLIIMLIFVLFVLLTGSRGGFLAILISLLILTLSWLLSNKNKITSLLKASFILFIMIMFFNIAMVFLPESISERYNINFSIEDGGAGRNIIWDEIHANYEVSPILNKVFGWGAGTVQYFNSKGAVAHNIWLETLIELGIVGTIILIIFYLSFLVKSFKMKEYVIAATFIGYLSMTLTMSLYSYKPIWNILFLIIILTTNNANIPTKNKHKNVEEGSANV